MTQTVQTGCRLLTHYTTGAKARDKPHRWMVLRRVPWEEVLQADPDHRQSEGNHPTAVWHIVIHELCQTNARGVPIICASFFASNFEAFFDVVREKFELLDEDDPLIIDAAVQDEDFDAVLQLYFDTGSRDNPKFFHTLASASAVKGQCLLHYCCENNFVNCVRYLLAGFTPQNAPEKWLQLADPLWQDSKWKNSAFSIAAYRGYAEMLSVLWEWAGEHGLRPTVLRMTDKKGQNLCDIVEEKLGKYRRDSRQQTRQDNVQQATAYAATFNVIAEAFGKRLIPDVPVQQHLEQRPFPLVIVDQPQGQGGGPGRATWPLPSNEMSLQQLVVFLGGRAEELRGTDVLILHVNVLQGNDADGEAQAATELLRLLASCTRVSFMKCTAEALTTVRMIQAANELFRNRATAWNSLGLVPSWTAIPAEGAPELTEFADAIEAFLETLVEACGDADLHGFDMPAGSLSYVPSGRKHLIYVLGHASTMKRTAFTLVKPGPEQQDLRRKLNEDPSAHNPLLGIFATLERKMLSKSRLIMSESVAEAMDGAWVQYSAFMVRSLVAHVRSITQWGPRIGLADGSGHQELMLRMADEAVLYLLKMRPSSQRPGLDVHLPALPAWRQEDFPLAMEYRERRYL